MWQNKIRILIVEDDSNELHLIKNVIEKKGFKTFVAKRDNQALSSIKHYSIHAILLDIMLPGKDGVSLAQDIQNIPSFKGPIFLMSGIFKGSDFIQNAIKRTEAKEYFLKPIDTEKLLQKLETHLEGLNADIPAKSDLPFLFTREFSSTKKRIRALTHSREIFGFDFPSFLSALLDTKTSGHINISCTKGVFGLTLHRGHIDVIRSTNTVHELKKEILNQNHLNEQEIRLSSQKEGYEFLQHIINLQCMSPHSINNIMGKEIKANLQIFVKEKSLNCNFSLDPILDKNEKSTHLKKATFAEMIHDIIKNNLALENLKSFFRDLMDHPIHRRPEFGRENMYLNLPLIKRNSLILEMLQKRPSIREIQEEKQIKEENLFPPIYFMLIFNLIVFGGKKKIQNVSLFKAKVQKIWKNIQNKNPFQIFEEIGAESYSPVVVEKQYQKYRDAYHPGLLPIHANENVRKMAHDSMSEVTEAYQILIDEKKQNEMKKKILEGEKDKKEKMKRLLNKIHPLIEENKMKEAFIELQNSNLDPSHEDIPLYKAWTEIKSKGKRDEVSKVASEWHKKLILFSSTIKQTSLYHFVMGLCHKAKGELLQAHHSFSKTLEINENFKYAKKELQSLKALKPKRPMPQKKTQEKETKSPDIFHMVGNLFRKNVS